jgi:tetratricopeptide (TPR) repeat protein
VYQALLQYFSLTDKRPDFVKTMAPIDVVYRHAYQLKTEGKFKEATPYYNHILERVRDHVNALIDVGDLLIEEKRFDAALACYNDALSYKPEEVINLLPNLTRVFDILGKKYDIFSYYQKALELAPVNAALVYNYANALCGAKQYQLALVQYELALRIDKDDVATLNNYALALENLNQYESALKNHKRALALMPNHPGILLNCINVLQIMQRHDAVIDACDQLLRMYPDNAGAHLFKSISLLLKGKLLLGFQGLEWRWMRPNIPKVFHTQAHHKKWLGDFSLRGKTIIVPLEYGIGFGDIIQFYRYIPLLTQQADKVITVAPIQLHSLLKTAQVSHQIITPEQEVPYFDCYCPIQSLPWAFKTDLNAIPNTIPYLFSDSNVSAQWEKKLFNVRPFKIGIAWSGKREDRNDAHRSIPTTVLSALFELDVDFYCLQIKIDSTDKANALAHKNVHFFESELSNFEQTAALIEQMDIVITVDTVIAHLAGALGKAVWILLSANPDWRWLMQGKESLWYPTARLFRQKILGEWGPVISKVNLELLKELNRG